MPHQHNYRVDIKWTGNLGSGTSGYRDYSRNHEITGAGKSAPISGSSEPAFRGEASRYNPEEMLLSALSTCHMLWMLHLCADAGITVVEYSDVAEGSMMTHADGAGEFIEASLNPRMVITREERLLDAMLLHEKAHQMCPIAGGVKFPVRHKPVVEIAAPPE
ncbi:MAG: hypothetical protein IANPNBLG_02328 [Bryobacteraceae bacterium]|nr:hypothetical protein [Bryobacteraceae bacterium]